MEHWGLARWLSLSKRITEELLIDYDCHMLRQQKKLHKKYLANVYVLNKVSPRQRDILGCTQDSTLVFQTLENPLQNDRNKRWIFLSFSEAIN